MDAPSGERALPDDRTSPPGYERPAFVLLVAFGLATLLGLLFASQSIVRSIATDRPVDFGWAIPSQLVVWYAWVALLYPLWWVFGRLRLGRRHGLVALAFHLGIGLVAAVSQVALVSVTWVALGIWDETLAETFRRLLVNQTFTSYSSYGLIAVSYHMVAYLRRLRREQETVRLRDEQLSAARLRALQNQLHPHFLFNALNTVSSYLRTGNPKRGAYLVSVLGDLLRYVLKRSRDPVTTVAEEVDFLDLYFELLRARFGDRIAFDREIDPAALEARVPTLVLQPLVENAVRHGVGERPGPGRIVVRARRVDDRLRLEVEDDGPGPIAAPEGDGFGLSGTRERVRELYGAGATVELRRRASEGALAVVDLPFLVASSGDGSGAAEAELDARTAEAR